MADARDILPDRYRGGRYLRRWSLVAGHPRCVEDALDTATALPEEVAAVEAANAGVYEAVAAVEAYEAAVRLAATEKPPATAPGWDDDGVPVDLPNPAHGAWLAAGALVAGAGAETVELAALRRADPDADAAPSADAAD